MATLLDDNVSSFDVGYTGAHARVHFCPWQFERWCNASSSTHLQDYSLYSLALLRLPKEGTAALSATSPMSSCRFCAKRWARHVGGTARARHFDRFALAGISLT